MIILPLSIGFLISLYIINWFFKFKMKMDIDDYGFFLFMPGFLISILFGLLLSIVFFKSETKYCSKVVEIGGCTQYNCAVRLKNNKKVIIQNPLLGDTYCEKHIKYRWSTEEVKN